MTFVSTFIYANEFSFKQPSLDHYTNVKSYDDEILRYGSIEVRRGDLRKFARADDLCVDCVEEEQKSFLDDESFQSAINIALVTTVVHTAFYAAEDKKKHALVGAIIGAGTTKLCQKLYNGKNDKLVCALTGAGAALLAGLGKEYWDSKGHGNVDAMDAVYTFVPGALISFKF